MAKDKSIIEGRLLSLTTLDAAELSKLLEEKWGVSASAPVAKAGEEGSSGVAAGGEAEFDVILTEAGPNRINVIKELRAITGLGLKEAKDLVERAPRAVKEAISKAEAAEIKTKLEQSGAQLVVHGSRVAVIEVLPAEENAPEVMSEEDWTAARNLALEMLGANELEPVGKQTEFIREAMKRAVARDDV